MHNLTAAEARERAELIAVRSYEVDLDLTTGPDRFSSVSRVQFTCRRPGESTFIEILGPAVHSVVLNGRELPSGAWDGERVTLADLRDENDVLVVADCAYSRTGEGLHRFVDPADGRIYTYTQLFLYDAHRMFACFDQPDLKAPWSLSVTAPDGWTVLSNAPGRETDPGHWMFDPTPPVATYFAALVAGPYHGTTRDHRGIALGLYCRQSLAPHLDPDELFEITGQSFDFYHARFGRPYPWGKYDQAFVPEFNAGAMENPGLVTIQDEQVFRSRVTEASREGRAMLIAHEMAHMWFGDLVTMRWWDDLWLNESFAEYMGHHTVAEATRFRGAWAAFAAGRKAWGYRQDELPSTHPVAGQVADTRSALLNFDGIAYAKGAGVLKQLVAWVGEEAFLRGLRAYFDEHAFANTSLADLLAALEKASGRDLGDWSREWLESAGVNTLRPDVSIAPDGTYRSAAVVQSAPEDHPSLRSHRVAIGLYARDGDRLVRRERHEVDVSGPRTEVPVLVGRPAADLLLLNDDDLTWTKIRLDGRSLDAVLAGDLTRLESPLARALAWGALWDMTRDAELPPGAFIRLVLDGIPAETEISLVSNLLAQVRRTIDTLGDPQRRDERLGSLARRCRALLVGAEPGSDVQLAYARAFAAAASEPADLELLRAWLEGRDVPEGLALDPELRWILVTRLAVLGRVEDEDIEAEFDRDRTSAGEQAAAHARAARPTVEAKEAAWRALVDSTELSNHLVAATARGFWQREQLELGRPYIDRFFEAAPHVWRERSQQIAITLVRWLFPFFHAEDGVMRRTDELLALDDLDPGLRRALVEHRADLVRALAARDVDRRG